jgi:hypothetical protein
MANGQNVLHVGIAEDQRSGQAAKIAVCTCCLPFPFRD